MPASTAICAVAATVVAALFPVAAIIAKSRVDALTMSSRFAIATSCSSVNPTNTFPSRIAMVAGMAPCERTISSTSRATCKLDGRGNPWLMMVDSKATIGLCAASAAATSGDSVNPRALIMRTILVRRYRRALDASNARHLCKPWLTWRY